METHSIETAGAEIVYDIADAQNGADGHPPLVMIGQPMDASGFRALASYLPDRVVVTYDPRGLGRSTRSDGEVTNTPTVQAEDVHAIITALGAGPVDMFASSGGAVTALALVADPLLSERSIAITGHRPDIDALKAAPTRIVIGVGEESDGIFTGRTSAAVAQLLETEAIVFPSHHGGFAAEDSGYPGHPEAFARRLRDVLDERG